MKKSTFYYVLFLITLQANLFAQDKNAEKGLILIKGNIENLPDGKMNIRERGESKYLATTETKDGKFQFQLSTTTLPEPIVVEMVHYDEKNVKRNISHKSYQASIFTPFFMLENGLEINGKLEEYSPSGFQTPDSLKFVRLDKPILGKQNEAYFAFDKYALTNVESMEKAIKKYPYSYHLLNLFNLKKRSYTDNQGFKLFGYFDKYLQESATGQKIKTHLETRHNYKLTAETMLTSADGFSKPVINKDDKVTMIILWASWCVPCRKEIPMLKQFYAKHEKTEGFSMVSVSIDDNKANWKVAYEKENMPWTQLLITSEVSKYATDIFQYDGAIPTILFVDNKGAILKKFTGYDEANQAEYEKTIEMLVRQ